jgi:hypothetical protein
MGSYVVIQKTQGKWAPNQYQENKCHESEEQTAGSCATPQKCDKRNVKFVYLGRTISEDDSTNKDIKSCIYKICNTLQQIWRLSTATLIKHIQADIAQK